MPKKKEAGREMIRSDVHLVNQGVAETRSQARAMILAGQVYIKTKRVEKSGELVASSTEFNIASRAQYVGRGGIKLNHAIESFNLDITDISALDIGASTGGFTDCLLQRGASYIYAIDVGYGQLADRIRNDSRVHVMERTNAREFFPLPSSVNLIVADVSFISLKLVLPPSIDHLSDKGYMLVLVKPQFEAGKDEVRPRGVINNSLVHAKVLADFCLWAINSGLRFMGIRQSPINGDKGNQEYFVLLQKVSNNVSFK